VVEEREGFSRADRAEKKGTAEETAAKTAAAEKWQPERQQQSQQ
jgi:hypothetical protein